MKFRTILWAVLLLPVMVQGEVKPRIQGLESNTNYMELLFKEQQLNQIQDSLLKLVDRSRHLYRTDSINRDKHGQQIVVCENELFELRDKIGVLVSSINQIEQQYILNNMNGDPVVKSQSADSSAGNQGSSLLAAPQKKNLIYNLFFQENLPPEDYRQLMLAQEMEQEPMGLITRFWANEELIDSLLPIYRKADRPVALEAYAKIELLQKVNRQISDSLGVISDYIYDHKSYAYNYLLEKMRKNAMLADFERHLRQTNETIAILRDQVTSVEVSGFIVRKKMVLGYEIALAELLELKLAKDSLLGVKMVVDRFHMDPSKVIVEPRNFIDYSPLVIGPPEVYSAQNPIPKAEIFTYGTVYRIQIGVFSHLQPISVFRNVSPLSYEVTEGGRYRYCAGGFLERSDAEEALEMIQQLGFRQPEIVVWRDGKFESFTRSSSAKLYRVEISGEGVESMGAQVKEIIETQAPGKEISRSKNTQGESLYLVGVFEDQRSAQALLARLSGVEGIRVRLLELEP